MNISQLISQLKALQSDLGDVPVMFAGNSGWCYPVGQVLVEELPSDDAAGTEYILLSE
jgi:hypothetical protein